MKKNHSFHLPRKTLLSFVEPSTYSTTHLQAALIRFVSTMQNPNLIMDQGQSFKSINRSVSAADEPQKIGKPSLENLAIETQLDIVRYLLFGDDTVVFGPPQEHEDGMPRRSLSILRVCKLFSSLASSVLYGENSFVVSDDSIYYYRHNVCVPSLPFGQLRPKVSSSHKLLLTNCA